MASAILSVGIVACTAVLAVGVVTAGAAAVFGQRLAGAADSAALAAADAASGAVAGEPCARAEEITAVVAFSLVRCDLDGLIVTVTVSGTFAGLHTTASARAGPPP